MIRLLAVILLFGVLEIVLLVRLAQITSAASVLLYLLVAAIIGGRLIARPGFIALLSGRKTTQPGPAALLTDRLLEIAAGLLLIVPGVLSDLLAVALLVRPLRSVLARLAARLLPLEVRTRASMWQAAAAQRQPSAGAPPAETQDTIDVASRRIE
jgi:UPF0716 protein FxsA